MRVYVRSLLFLFLVAIKELRPEVKIEARNSLGSALFCEITNDIVLSNYDLKALEDYMKELAAKSEPIIYKHINKKKLKKFYASGTKLTAWSCCTLLMMIYC